MMYVATLFLNPFILAITPTYTKDLKPIFHNRCSKCHDSLPNKNWQLYKNAYNYRTQIKQKVLLRDMPPRESIPQSEIDTIVNWVDTGAKK